MDPSSGIILRGWSTAGKRPYDLDIITGLERCRAPLRAAYNGAVQGDGEEFGGGVDTASGKQLAKRRHCDFFLHAVDPQPRHRASAEAIGPVAVVERTCLPLKRSGVKGSTISGRRPVNTYALTAAAVSGVSKIPLRWCPVATTSPSIPLGPSIGASSREPGRKPTQVSAIGSSSIAGTARQAPSISASKPPAVK